jgi:aminoglycoside 3'-phosphotransferase-1
MDAREKHCGPASVPADLAALLQGYRWSRDLVGESGASVYRLHGKPHASDLYLKHGTGDHAGEVSDEAARLIWLASRISVPSVHYHVGGSGEAWLLTEAVAGRTAYQLIEAAPGEAGAVVDAIGRYLRGFHAVSSADCPFDASHRVRLAAARARLDAGLVDEDDFDAERAGWAAEDVWAAMTTLLPLPDDPVVTHGDFSLHNIFVEAGAVSGVIDVGRAGVADRYQDIAVLWNCLGEFGGELRQRFVDSYGLDRLDHARLRFHLLLDEFF